MDRIKFKADIAQAIKAAREAKGLSQAELAAKAGLEPSHISHFESGRRTPDLYNFCVLARALKIPAKNLLPNA